MVLCQRGWMVTAKSHDTIECTDRKIGMNGDRKDAQGADGVYATRPLYHAIQAPVSGKACSAGDRYDRVP